VCLQDLSAALLAMPLLSELRLSGLRITPVAGLDAAVKRYVMWLLAAPAVKSINDSSSVGDGWHLPRCIMRSAWLQVLLA
jgi:hypothetical protein